VFKLGLQLVESRLGEPHGVGRHHCLLERIITPNAAGVMVRG
jgi:hypothetical protein